MLICPFIQVLGSHMHISAARRSSVRVELFPQFRDCTESVHSSQDQIRQYFGSFSSLSDCQVSEREFWSSCKLNRWISPFLFCTQKRGVELEACNFFWLLYILFYCRFKLWWNQEHGLHLLWAMCVWLLHYWFCHCCVSYDNNSTVQQHPQSLGPALQFTKCSNKMPHGAFWTPHIESGCTFPILWQTKLKNCQTSEAHLLVLTMPSEHRSLSALGSPCWRKELFLNKEMNFETFKRVMWASGWTACV